MQLNYKEGWFSAWQKWTKNLSLVDQKHGKSGTIQWLYSMAIRKARIGKKNVGQNQRDTYYFDIEKCKQCPFREGCYQEGAKSKTYSVTIKSTEHKDQEAFQNSDEFKFKAKSRYKIEAKNSELKHRHGYDVAISAGLFGMQMQGAMTIFAVNLKRIITLMKDTE